MDRERSVKSFHADESKNRGIQGFNKIGNVTIHNNYHGSEREDVRRDEKKPIFDITFENPFFTGRDEELEDLHSRLLKKNTAAISGLGGIGKTQLAIEYAHRYRKEYENAFWVRADTSETLGTSYSEISKLLDLSEKNSDKQEIIDNVKRWLRTNGRWLLIFDNADRPDLIIPFVPRGSTGHILVTTRSADVCNLGLGIVNPLEIEVFSPEQGALFLLRRAELLSEDGHLDDAIPHDQNIAVIISKELGGLPLALDQAGAYIAGTKSDLTDYQEVYKEYRAELLGENRNHDYPQSVATTWNISFKKVEEENPTAADLMRFCAFLSPDNIPEAALTNKTEQVMTGFALGNAIRTIGKYSLMKRSSRDKTLSIHRLVQMVLQDQMMNTEIQSYWAKKIAVVLKTVLVDHMWLYIPHIEAYVSLVERYSFEFREIENLLSSCTLRPSFFSSEQLENFYRRILKIQEKTLGPDSLDVTGVLGDLAIFYEDQKRYDEAESTYKRALGIYEKIHGPDSSDVAAALRDLARFYRYLERYDEAESTYKRALGIYEKIHGPDSSNVAGVLGDLVRFYEYLERYDEAESTYKRALGIYEKIHDPDNSDEAAALRDLARFYRDLESEKLICSGEELYLTRDALSR
jgi:tetratricopeptide (TPR) repeat protein